MELKDPNPGLNTDHLQCSCFNCQVGLNSGHSFIGHVCNIDGCTQLFIKLKGLQQHLKEHQQKSFTCGWANCGQIFDQREKFNTHLAMHADNNCFLCSVCNKKFFNRFLLSKHIKTHALNVVDKRRSNDYDSQYKMKPSISKNSLPAKKVFMCDVAGCTKSYMKANRLKLHRQIFHEINETNLKATSTSNTTKQYICDFNDCGKRFTDSTELVMHARVHNKGIQPHLYDFKNGGKSFRQFVKCPCSNCFYNRHDMNGGAKEHNCDFAGCGISYKDSSQLVIHLRTHIGDRPAPCAHDCAECFSKSIRSAFGEANYPS